MESEGNVSDSNEPAAASADSLLLTFLQNHDASCPLCKYNLRNLTEPRCPECGRALKLVVGMVEPYIAAWVTLAVASFASGGIGMLFVITLPKEDWRTLGRELSEQPLLLFTLAVFVGSIPVAIAVLSWRRRIMKMRRKTQWILAVTMVALFLAALAVVGIRAR